MFIVDEHRRRQWKLRDLCSLMPYLVEQVLLKAGALMCSQLGSSRITACIVAEMAFPGHVLAAPAGSAVVHHGEVLRDPFRSWSSCSAVVPRPMMAVASIGACLALQHHSSRRVRGTHVVLRRASQVEAVRLVSVKEGQLVVDQTNLALLMESLRASSCERVAVVSIAGALRQGKSFFLDLFARYLESSEDMLSGSLQDSQRFCWKSGMERVTDGVWACPQVFEGPGSAKTRVGILLLDTQGLRMETPYRRI